MNGKTSKPHAKALLVAIGHYENKCWDTLNEAPEAARALADVLEAGGYIRAHPELLEEKHPTLDSAFMAQTLGDWLRSADRGDTVVVYWTGHGKKEGDGHFLLTENSPPNNFGTDNAFRTSELGSLAAKSPAEKVLILLDTCYSGAGAGEIANMARTVLATRPEQPGRCPAYAVIASAHPLEKVQEAAFCKALAKVLNRPLGIRRRWTDNDQFIHASDLAEAIETVLDDNHHVYCEMSGSRQRFIPNPRYRGELPAEDVETRGRRLEAAEEHFVPASRGIEVGEEGWYFSGRRRILSRLVDWLKHAEHGQVVVTGPAGSGKSAVMGRLAILSDPTYRAEADRVGALADATPETLPPEGIIDVAVHLKGKTLFDCIGAVANAYEIEFSGRDRADPKALIRAVGDLKRRVTLLFDALDEAKPGHPHAIGERLIKPLAALSQVRVLVGTRRSPDGATTAKAESRHERLRALFGADALILDLEDEPETPHDIAQYVRLRLWGSRHRNNHEGIERVAGGIAKKAAGIFLYARIACRTLQDAERLDIDLPADALGAFVDNLTRRFGNGAEKVNDVLAALAWGEGKGLTRRVWAPVASTLSPTGALYSDASVGSVLQDAGWYIVEAGEDGQAVYRLAHQVFAEHYRSRVDSKDANARITEALAAGIKGKDWLDADGYLWRHLASHASAGRVLDTLVADAGYLAVADPIRLVPALATLTDGTAREIADVYRHIAHELPMAEPLERMALIHMVACQEAPALASDMELPLLPAWRCRWADWMPSAPNMTLGGHTDDVHAVALGEVDGEPVVVSGSRDKTVRLWDARTGRPRGEPLTGHTCSVNAVALGEVDGQPVVVSGDGGYDRVRLWDARTGRPHELLYGFSSGVNALALDEVDGEAVMVIGSGRDSCRLELLNRRTSWLWPETMVGHTDSVLAVALGAVDDEPVVVSGSKDKTVRLWNVRTRRPRGEPLVGHTGSVLAVAVGAVDGEPVVVSGSADKTVRLWDARTGRPRGEFLTGHTGWVNAVALDEVDDEPVVISGSGDHMVRLWDARTGRPRGEPLIGHTDSVLAVAVGAVDGGPVVVSGSADKTVRLWDARTLRPHVERLTHHKSWVLAVAVGAVDGEPVVVSGSRDKTVRLWDVRTGQPRIEPLTGHTDSVHAVALGEVDGKLVVVSGSKDKTVRLWDAHTGRSRGDPLTRHTSWVNAVALGEVDGQPVVISGSKDHTVRLWDARTGRPRGDPLTGHTGSVLAVAVGEVDGEPVVVSGSKDKTVRLWDVRTGLLRGKPLAGHTQWVCAVALGEVDGEPMVVSGSEDKTLRLWDARTRRPHGEPLTGHTNYVNAVAVGEVDGEPVVVSGSQDDTVRLWDARSHSLLRVVPLRSKVTSLAMGKDSEVAVSAANGLLVLDF